MTAPKPVTDETLDGQIVTYTGRIIRPLDPDPDKLNIVDIAHALSNNCRFTGHVRTFYSVAEHSVRVAKILPARHKLWGLMHDASEAYLSDIARPIKMTPTFGAVYKEVEANLMEAIIQAFMLNPIMPKQVKVADNVLLAAEQRDLMPRWRRHEGEFEYPETIVPWSPYTAKARFLNLYEELTGIKPRR